MENCNNKSGANLLNEWLTDTGRKITWFASVVPANRSLVHQWLNGKHHPRAIYRNRIDDITGGAVPADSGGASNVEKKVGGK